MRFAILILCAALAGCAGTRALDEGDFAAMLRPGMSQGQVRLALGEPARVEDFARLGETSWDYPFRDTWGYMAYLAVIFDAQGRLLRTQHIRIEPNDQ